jgi:hypothetical protein
MNIEDQIDPSIVGYVRPPREYRGTPLRRFTAGQKLLLRQATASNDGVRNSGLWTAVALVYLLSIKDVGEASRQAFNRPEFREKAFAWYEASGGGEKEINELADEILTEAEQTKVEVDGKGGTDPKNA